MGRQGVTKYSVMSNASYVSWLFHKAFTGSIVPWVQGHNYGKIDSLHTSRRQIFIYEQGACWENTTKKYSLGAWRATEP